MLQGAKPRSSTLEYESEKIDYTLTKSYVPDFVITKRDGSKIYVEAKGLGRAFDYNTRAKMEAVKEQHPDIDLRIVFMADRPLRKGSNYRPSDWAVKHGYRFAINEIPKGWFKE